jgi:hypothetical protein
LFIESGSVAIGNSRARPQVMIAGSVEKIIKKPEIHKPQHVAVILGEE